MSQVIPATRPRAAVYPDPFPARPAPVTLADHLAILAAPDRAQLLADLAAADELGDLGSTQLAPADPLAIPF